jgi:hypothetical protein
MRNSQRNCKTRKIARLKCLLQLIYRGKRDLLNLLILSMHLLSRNDLYSLAEGRTKTLKAVGLKVRPASASQTNSAYG